MTIEARSDGDGRRRRVLGTVPRPGTVLVGSPAPPEVRVDRCVDVGPGIAATFDGDRLRLPLVLRRGDERRHFGRTELPALEDAVRGFLDGQGSAAVRFGDRAACRRILPTAVVAAIERRIGAAARREGETLVAWSSRPAEDVDRRRYDVVLR